MVVELTRDEFQGIRAHKIAALRPKVAELMERARPLREALWEAGRDLQFAQAGLRRARRSRAEAENRETAAEAEGAFQEADARVKAAQLQLSEASAASAPVAEALRRRRKELEKLERQAGMRPPLKPPSQFNIAGATWAGRQAYEAGPVRRELVFGRGQAGYPGGTVEAATPAAQRLTGENAVRQAERQVATAQKALDTAENDDDRADARRRLHAANRALAEAVQHREELAADD